MRILDMRPRAVRLMSYLWGRGSAARGLHARRPEPLHPAARCVAAVADGFIARRVAARRPPEPYPAVVSVGNLALGGTGKTPVVAALAEALAASGRQGAVLTRGFGSPLAGPLTVDPANAQAGDEARVMATILATPGWPVIQARHRARGLDHIRESYPAVEVVIVEDGHQTARLGRHLDVVILDGWTVTAEGGCDKVCAVTGHVVPFGPWRESAAGADRAGIWLLETDDDTPASGVGGQAVASFRRSLTLREQQGGHQVDSADGRFAVLSGIARPEAFEQALGNVLPKAPVLAVRCGDHVRYNPGMVAEISRIAHEDGADFLVTTAKDWVKLKPFWPAGLPVLVADLEIRWGCSKTLPALVEERLGSILGR